MFIAKTQFISTEGRGKLSINVATNGFELSAHENLTHGGEQSKEK